MDAKIYVAGHRGLVGAAIVRKPKELDLTRQKDTKPDGTPRKLLIQAR